MPCSDIARSCSSNMEIFSLRLRKRMKMRNMFAMMMNPDIKSRKTESSTPELFFEASVPPRGR